MSTQIKAAVALVVVAAAAWYVWSTAFANGPGVVEEVPPGIDLVQPRPEPPKEKVELVQPEPVPEKPAPKPRGRKNRAEEPAADEASQPALSRVVVPPPQAGEPGTISGIVVDVYGQAVDASVTVVTGGGSIGMSTERTEEGKGKFKFSDRGAGEYTIQATTKSGMIGIQGNVRIDANQGVAGLMLTVEPGATLKITMNGVHDTARCGLTSGGVLIDDFTLRNGKTATNIVPSGMVFLQVYGGAGDDKTVYEERSLSVFSGEDNTTTFDFQ
jgi:hypothetical protein